MKKANVFASLNPSFIRKGNSFTFLFSSATLLRTLFVLSLLWSATGCDKDEMEPVQVIPTVNIELPADKGDVGLVIDTREIFRKGYIASKAEMTLPLYAAYNTILDIDPVLHIATFRIANDQLTQEEKDDFDEGILVNIVIRDDQDQTLTSFTDKVILDDSGEPLKLTTSLPHFIPPAVLREDIPYYIQPLEIGGDGSFPLGGVLESESPLLYTFALPDNRFNFKYYVKPASDSTYYILRADNSPMQVPTFYFFRKPNSDLIEVSENPAAPLAFVIEHTPEGWASIREAGTNLYLTVTEGTSSTSDHRKALRMWENGQSRFRFITKEINWSATDRGTIYQRPIMPPAQIDFAYEATILNCSSGTITEEVGTTKSRTSTRTMETTESLELFASAELTVGLTTGAEAGASIPAVGEVKATVEYNTEFKFTTSLTASKENRISNEKSETTEVSRTRSIEVLPYTGVEVYDAVRTVRNARTPFTQVIRFSANYSNGTPLTVAELRSQMLFNRVEGIIVGTGTDYVDISLRGDIRIDQIFEGETGAKEIIEACP